MGPTFSDEVLITIRQREIRRKRKRHCEDEGRDWSDAAIGTANRIQKLRGKGRFTPRAFGGSMDLITP